MFALPRPLALASAFAIVLGGCATIPADQCAKTDWYELGLKDGRAGYPVERLVEHRDACADVKVAPDELRYLQGRKVGVTEYCQPDNAFRDGLAGGSYAGLCDATFARNHAAAAQVAALRKDLEANRSAISWREAEIRGDTASDSRRSNLRSEIRDLDRQRDRLRDDLVTAERTLDRLRATMVVVPAPALVVAMPAPPPPVPTPRAVTVGRPGNAIGTMHVGKVLAPLRFAYVFVAPDPLDGLKPRPMVLLTEKPIPDDVLAQAADLDAVLSQLPHYVLAIRNEAKPAKTALIVWHPHLGNAPVVQADAQASGTLKFDAYGPARVTGTLASPQTGNAGYAWNRNLRVNVRFDAPLTRRFPA